MGCLLEAPSLPVEEKGFLSTPGEISLVCPSTRVVGSPSCDHRGKGVSVWGRYPNVIFPVGVIADPLLKMSTKVRTTIQEEEIRRKIMSW